MKLSKSFLFASLIASSIALTGCNEKESKAPQAQAQQASQPQAQQETKTNLDPLIEQANAEFKQVASVKVSNINVSEGVKSLSVTYTIENLSDKAISALQWITLYKADGKLFYAANLPALQFEKTIAPKATETLTLSTEEEAVLSQIRPYISNNTNVQFDIIGTFVSFADGSVVGLTPQTVQ